MRLIICFVLCVTTVPLVTSAAAPERFAMLKACDARPGMLCGVPSCSRTGPRAEAARFRSRSRSLQRRARTARPIRCSLSPGGDPESPRSLMRSPGSPAFPRSRQRATSSSSTSAGPETRRRSIVRLGATRQRHSLAESCPPSRLLPVTRSWRGVPTCVSIRRPRRPMTWTMSADGSATRGSMFTAAPTHPDWRWCTHSVTRGERAR